MVSGFLVRPAAFGFAAFITIAMIRSHWGNGFFLNQGPGKRPALNLFCLDHHVGHVAHRRRRCAVNRRFRKPVRCVYISDATRRARRKDMKRPNNKGNGTLRTAVIGCLVILVWMFTANGESAQTNSAAANLPGYPNGAAPWLPEVDKPSFTFESHQSSRALRRRQRASHSPTPRYSGEQ